MLQPLARETRPMTNFRHLFISLIYLALSTLLLSCGGSSDTVGNPNNNANLGYQGPPAATDDVRRFEVNLWNNLKAENRCGQCHGNGQNPDFVNLTDVNQAYSNSVPLVNLADPPTSLLVTKVGSGHNCWLTSNVACADSIEQMVINWAGGTNTANVRTINLTAPTVRNPGDSKSFPTDATDNAPNSFELTVYPLLTAHCQGCHEESANLPISPLFANADKDSAFESAKPKMDIDTPTNSRFVVRLREEFHNCWTNDCKADAITMQTAIQNFAGAIPLTALDPTLVTSKALTLADGIIASGGNRHESNLIAIWEFKTNGGGTVFDTSGIEPAVDLTLSGSYAWLGGYGINLTGGKAQADTIRSKKLNDFVRSSGEYSIEAWVVPANVSQEDANIISYSAGANSRNFTLGQTLYNYDFYNRTTESNANGEVILATPDADEVLQSTLQHVVATYDPVQGRSIYVNGKAILVNDLVTTSTSISNWDDSFAFLLGNEVSNNRTWNGQLRLVAMHNRVLTPAQVIQNFDVGVGQKFFMLFSVAEQLSIPDSYILFEVSQFDSYSYLFDKPAFINLDADWVPVPIDIEGIRIGINGKEALVGQAYANLRTTISSGLYNPQTGQLLSTLGTIVALEKGSATSFDEFFLTFEKLGTNTHVFSDPLPGISATPAADVDTADIGIKTFEEINASIAAITGVPVTVTAVNEVYQQFKQQFPTTEAIDTFLPSHQMAIAQLTLASCNVLIDDNAKRTIYFPGFDFTAQRDVAFNNATKRNQIINPLLTTALNIDQGNSANDLTVQPTASDIRDSLGSTAIQTLSFTGGSSTYQSLITQLVSGGSNDSARTIQIAKAVCAAAVGGAVILIQ
jgi:hypothetical protein